MAYSCKAKRLPTGISFGLAAPRANAPPGLVIATTTVAFLIATDKEPGATTVRMRGERDRSPTSRAAYPQFDQKCAHNEVVRILTQGILLFGGTTLTIEYATMRDFGSDASYKLIDY